MVRIASRFASAGALAAALSLAVTPASARGWYGYGRGHHHDGIDGGDILAGVLILGGIAAIASAASHSSKRDRQVRDDYRNPQPYPQQRYDYQAPPPSPAAPASGNYQPRGIDGAVDMCVDQVERGDTHVASVDNASRTADGWRVAGQLSKGGGFNCWIDNDGRVRQVDFGRDRYSAYNDAAQGNQWTDQDYARARAAQADAAGPGGPVDGDLAYAGN